jgi:hypothetical protein
MSQAALNAAKAEQLRAPREEDRAERSSQEALGVPRTFCGDFRSAPKLQRVLADLRRFCGITKGGIVVSPVSRTVDPYATIYRAALRDVYLRIAGFLTSR